MLVEADYGRLGRAMRYKINRIRMSRPASRRCDHLNPRDHGGVRNVCLKLDGHGWRHVDLWGDKWW